MPTNGLVLFFMHPPLDSLRKMLYFHCTRLPVLLLPYLYLQLQSWNSQLHTHTHQFNGPLSGTTQVSQYQKGKTNPDFREASDTEWQWHQLGHMQVCTLLQTGNHACTSPLSFLQERCPSCHPTNSVRALKA